MSTLRQLQVEDCHTVETTVEGRIRRVVYPKHAPSYGLVYVHDGMNLGELTLAEALDLTEAIELLAIHDGYFCKRHTIPRPSWVDRFVDWLVPKLLWRCKP